MRAVPNWHLMGKPNPPEILSNKLVLTPPVPGNQRGAAWTEKSLQHSLWNVDVDFRATGPERGGGNFNIWYVRNGREEIGTSSIYTAGRFDGLALVIDQYAGSVRLCSFSNSSFPKTNISFRAVSSVASSTTAAPNTNPITASTP